jgi:hypothetical protein
MNAAQFVLQLATNDDQLGLASVIGGVPNRRRRSQLEHLSLDLRQFGRFS